jgi:hypothetical protein
MIIELEKFAARNESSCSTRRRPDEVTSSLGWLNLTGPRSDPLRVGSHGASPEAYRRIEPQHWIASLMCIALDAADHGRREPAPSSFASRLVAKS